MPGKDASGPENSPPKATTPEPLQSGATYTVRAAWVAKVIKWFVDGWTRAHPGDGLDDDYRSDLIDAPCNLPKDFRYAALRLLPQAADEVIRLKSVLSWTSPDDANRLARVIRVIESEIVGTDESSDQAYDEIPLNELRRLCIELENAMVQTAVAPTKPGGGAGNGGNKPKRGRPPKSKADNLDGVVRKIIQNGDAETGYIPVKNLMEKYKDRIPSGTKLEKLRSRIRRALDRAAHNEAVEK